MHKLSTPKVNDARFNKKVPRTFATLTLVLITTFTASTARSEEGVIGNRHGSLSAYGIVGDSGIGAGISFSGPTREIPEFKAQPGSARIEFSYSRRQDGQAFYHLHSFLREGDSLVSDAYRIKITPFKTELNTRYGLPSVGYIDRSSDGKTAAFINTRLLTLASFRDSNGTEADNHSLESAIDLAFRHQLSPALSVNAETSFALGWGANARSSEVKGTVTCRLGENSPWCLDVSAISQTVAFKDTAGMFRRDAAQSIRLGVSYSPAN